jgi:hypothetical protein
MEHGKLIGSAGLQRPYFINILDQYAKKNWKMKARGVSTTYGSVGEESMRPASPDSSELGLESHRQLYVESLTDRSELEHPSAYAERLETAIVWLGVVVGALALPVCITQSHSTMALRTCVCHARC